MKTSRLSLAAITVLGITTASLSASNLIDIKLPHNSWKFIGVNGGFTESSGGYDINTTQYDKSANETVDDNASTTVYNDGSGDLVTFKVIDHSSATEFSSAKMYVSSSGHSYDGTATQPEMYVYLNTGDGNTTPDIRIKFQSDYENDTFYLELNGSTNVYSGTFSSSATYDNPQALTAMSSDSGSVSEGNLSIAYVFDRNITNNPGHPGKSGAINSYTYSSNHDAIGSSDTLRIYYYDAVNKSWKTYIKKNGTEISADFDTLEKGKGYWVKFTHANSLNEAGLLLGDEGISSSDYNASELTDGWNMLSFNDSSLIATGGTGMILEFNNTEIPCFTLSDSEGTESVDINTTYRVSDSNKTRIVQQINKQIAQAQAYGTLSKNFNVRAYLANEYNKTILVSDGKFRLTDDDNNTIIHATTLANQTLYVPSLGRKAASGADINTTAVESVYGEHVLGLRIPTDTATFSSNTILADLGQVFITIGDNNSTSTTKDVATSIDTSANNIAGVHGTMYAVQIDTDFNGQVDTILMVNPTYNFSVQDGVFVKTYQVNTSARNAATLKIRDINGTTHETISFTDSNDSASKLAKEIRIDGTSTSKFDANGTNGYLFVATDDEDYRNFYIEQTSGVNRLTLVTDSTENNATGTVREVYSPENLARASVDYYTKAQLRLVKEAEQEDSATNSYVEFNITSPNRDYMRIRYGYFTDTNSSDTASGAHDYNVSYSGKTIAVGYIGNDLNISVAPISDLNSSSTTVAANILAYAINYHFTEKNSSIFNITATASSGTVTLYGDFNFTIDANDSTTFDFNISDTNSTALLTDSNLTIPSLTSDLGYSKVYAGSVTTDVEDPVPNLQSITGYKVRKILTTNEDADGSSISWNFIDLTKSAGDWFDAEDGYNLFSFDKEKGYWVYLENTADTTFDNFPKGTDSTALTVTTTYNHSFVNDTNSSSNPNNYTTTNYISNIAVQVDVSDISDTSLIDRAVAKFNGKEYKMTQSGNLYTTTIEEVQNLGSSSTLDLNATLFTSDNFPATVSKVIDNSAPTRPTLTLNSRTLTDVTLTSSADTVYFHAYSGDVDMAGTNLVEGNISASNGQATFNLCSKAESFNSNIGHYRFTAVDNANMSYGLISDIGYLNSSDYNATIYPIYKDSSILTVTGDTKDSLPMDYNSSCETTGTASATDHGVELKGVDGYTVTVAFETNSSTFATAATANLKTVDLKVDGTKVAQIKFDGGTYKNSGQVFLMQYNGNIYSTDFNTLSGQDGDAAYFTDTNITMLTGQTIAE